MNPKSKPAPAAVANSRVSRMPVRAEVVSVAVMMKTLEVECAAGLLLGYRGAVLRYDVTMLGDHAAFRGLRVPSPDTDDPKAAWNTCCWSRATVSCLGDGGGVGAPAELLAPLTARD